MLEPAQSNSRDSRGSEDVFLRFDDGARRGEWSYLFETPWFPALLSVFVMGLGQLFNGESRRASVFFFFQLAWGLYLWDHFRGHLVTALLQDLLGSTLYGLGFGTLMLFGALTWAYQVFLAYEMAEHLRFIHDRHRQQDLFSPRESLGHFPEELTEGVRRGQMKQFGFVAGIFLLYTGAVFFLGSQLRSADELENMRARVELSGNPELHRDFGRLLLHLGRFEEARVQFQAALEKARTPSQESSAREDLATLEALLGKDGTLQAGPELSDPPPPIGLRPELPEPPEDPILDPPPGTEAPVATRDPPPDLVLRPSPPAPTLAGSGLQSDYLLERAELELSLENPAGAKKALAGLSPADSQGFRALLVRARLAAAEARIQEAEGLYRRASQVSPSRPEAYLGLARLAAERGSPSEEEVYLRRAAVAAPSDLETVFRFSDFLTQKGRPDEAYRVLSRALTDRPKEPRLLDRAFQASKAAENPERAFEAARALARMDYQDGEVYRFLVQESLNRKKMASARQALEQLKALEPNRRETVLLEAKVLRASGEHRKILRLLRPWVGTGSLEMAKLLASSAKAVRDYPIGIQALEEALRIHPPDGDALKLLGILRKRIKDYPGALKAYGEALRLDPADKEALYLAGFIHLVTQSYLKGIANLEKVERLSPGYADTAFYLGSCYEGAGRTSQAIQSFEKVTSRSSNYRSAQEAIQRLRQKSVAPVPSPGPLGSRDPGLLSEASLPSSRDLDPPVRPEPTPAATTPSYSEISPRGGRPPPASVSVSVDAYSGILRDAEIAFQNGRFAKALEHYEAVLKIKPDHARSYFQKGMILRELGRAEEAVEAFEIARSLDPGRIETLTELANLQANLGKKQAAAETLEALVRIDPKHLAARYQLGILYEMSLNNYAKAEEHYQAATWYHPEYLPVYEYLGNVYYKQGKFAAATDAFRKLLEGEPSNHKLRFKLASAEIRAGQIDSARKRLQTLKMVATDDDWLYQRIVKALESLEEGK